MEEAVAQSVGPVDIAVILFEGELDQGGIREAVSRAVDLGTVRVLDVLLVRKDETGAVRLFDSEAPEAAEELPGFPTVAPDLIGEEDATAIAAEMQDDSTVLMIAWENVWAAEIASAIRDLGGQLLVMQRVAHEDVESVLTDLSQTSEAQS